MSFKHSVRKLGGIVAVAMTVLAGSVLGAIPGCSNYEPEEKEPKVPSPVDAACTGYRWIGKVQDGMCPEVSKSSGWAGSKLFQSDDPVLSQYCLFQWAEVDGPPRVSLLPRHGALPYTDWMQVDCAAVAPMGDTAAEQVRMTLLDPLDAAFAKQADANVALPLPAGSPSVRVAVLDSWPNGSLGVFHHGVGMAGIIDRIACGPFGMAACPVETIPYLVLEDTDATPEYKAPVYSPPDPVAQSLALGGYIGHIGRLATAIHEAVRSNQIYHPESRLILNLSVGWDDIFNQKGTSPVEAVHDALKWASCNGALVITAAGNTSGGRDDRVGPIYPAAWAAEPAPSPGDNCMTDPLPMDGPPLVYSVAGVDGADMPLFNARRGSRTKLAAPAFAVPGTKTVVAPNLVTTTATAEAGPFTGSSVAAAAVSGAAVLLWLHNTNVPGKPDMTPDQVMERIYEKGVNLGESADFCLDSEKTDGICPPIHRLSVCKALTDNVPNLPCKPDAGENPVIGSYKMDVAGVSVTEEWEAVTSFNIQKSEDPASNGTIPGCGAPLFVPAGASARTAYSACPVQELPTSVLNVALDPQPGPNPCPACTAAIAQLNMEDIVSLDLAIDQRYGGAVCAQVLTLMNQDKVIVRYDLAAATEQKAMIPGNLYRVHLPWIGAKYGTDFTTATVEWLDAAPESSDSPDCTKPLTTSKASQLLVTTVK